MLILFKTLKCCVHIEMKFNNILLPGILQDREVVELFLHYTVNPKPSVQFGDTPRCCLTGKEQVVSRFVFVCTGYYRPRSREIMHLVASVLP